jgi:hypothetical protein
MNLVLKSPKDGENGLKKMFPKVFVHHLENRKNIACMDSYIATICHESQRFKRIQPL